MDKKCRKQLKDVLSNNTSCYVLITCDNPSKDGELNVEMTYQGDSSVASYLLQGAQYYIDQEEEEKECAVNSKKIRLVE